MLHPHAVVHEEVVLALVAADPDHAAAHHDVVDGAEHGEVVGGRQDGRPVALDQAVRDDRRHESPVTQQVVVGDVGALLEVDHVDRGVGGRHDRRLRLTVRRAAFAHRRQAGTGRDPVEAAVLAAAAHRRSHHQRPVRSDAQVERDARLLRVDLDAETDRLPHRRVGVVRAEDPEFVALVVLPEGHLVGEIEILVRVHPDIPVGLVPQHREVVARSLRIAVPVDVEVETLETVHPG